MWSNHEMMLFLGQNNLLLGGEGKDSHIKVTGVMVIPFRGSNLWFCTPQGVKI